MYLKNLTGMGFKSFADKTSLNFMPGITAIVGPNGCGKSNVADAIRWVLGEQSAKALRGNEMADVIFNGTDERKPTGMAEVSVTVGEVDQEHLRAAGVELSYNEVTITRRVFRDGVSEYFINKTPCRLKDIQQLFMGTGVGRSSYSIMAQGHITQLLSSRPEDRRMVFEEAAGITRFKSQKKEALRKLESTDQNLLRVSDLIREVKRQIGSLQRQAGKARRYKQLLLELQHLDTQLARHQFDVLRQEMGEREAAADQLRTEMEAGSEEVLRGEDQLSQLRARLAELEHEISATQQQGLELKGQIDQHDSRIHFNEERLGELEQQNAKALSDIAQAEERQQAAEQELAAVTQRLQASTQALEQQRQTLAAKRTALQQLDDNLRSQQEALRQTQSEAFGAAQQTTRLRNEITALDLQKQGNAVRLEKLSAEKIQLEEERRRLEARQQEFVSSVEAEKLSAQAKRGTLAEQQARLQTVQQELARVTRELDELLRQQAAHRSRLNVLEQLQAGHEGFSAGALAALKQSPHNLGALVDKLRVPERYITAIEAALGHHLQLVLTEAPESACQILSELHLHRQGRASIAPLALQALVAQPPARGGDGSSPSSPAAVSCENSSSASLETDRSGAGSSLAMPPVSSPAEVPTAIADPPTVEVPATSAAPSGAEAKPATDAVAALSVVEAAPAVQGLLQRLLGQTLIVPDLAAAAQLWRQQPGRFDLVTVAGELLSRHGVFTGGSHNGKDQASASILGRKNQIAELQAQLNQLQDHVGEVSRQKGAFQSEQTALQASLQQQQSELRSQEVAIATHEGECKALDNALRLLGQKVETVVYEIQDLADQDQESTRRRQELATQMEGLETRERALQQRLTELNAGLENLRQQRETANNALTEIKVALATEEQLGASFQQQKRTLEQRLRELSTLLAQRRGEISSLLDRRAQFQSEIQESRLRIDSLRHEREQVNNQAAELLSQKQTQESEIAGRDESLRNARHRLTELQEQRSALDVELAQKNMATQNLRDRIQQKYQLNLDDVRSECITITFADEGPAKVETLTPEEMANRGLATNWETVAQQVAALQQRLDEMGPVNLVAIEEYEETEQRHQFLSAQFDDLTKAKEQLLEVINRINTQTKEMFSETFAKVRENFAILFTEIFGGGKADLMLVDEGDVLESGIDILARPPGKQLKSISLLSGGEQTMTAVALLFAIYQVKPSPFCVLDELDAPLDESNINRFIGVLKRFLTYSQFIIITHNKRTIGTADVIYGVTMEQQGISKIVSMRFQKAKGTVADHPPGLGAASEMPLPVQPATLSAVDTAAALPATAGPEPISTEATAAIPPTPEASAAPPAPAALDRDIQKAEARLYEVVAK